MVAITNARVNETIETVLRQVSSVFNGATKRSLVKLERDGLRLQTRLQVLFGLKFESASERLIYESIMTHALSAEKLGPGGFDICIEKLLAAYDTESGLDTLKASLKAFQELGTTIPTLADVHSCVLSRLSPKLATLTIQALELAGFGGKIIIEKSRTDVISVERVSGYTYALNAATIFNPSVLSEARICCIDGFVEGVHELHHLFEEIVAAKAKLILLVRGMSDDVKHTLKVNYDRGILLVYPYIVPFDLQGINTLADVAIATGTDVVSSTKGQLISTIKLNDLGQIPSATVLYDKLILINPTSRDRVSAHVKYLKNKRAEQTDDSVARLFDLRIRSMSPNQVLIRLPNDENFVIDSQEIDYALRGVRSLNERGMLGTEPAAANLAGVKHAIMCCEMLHRLGAIIPCRD